MNKPKISFPAYLLMYNDMLGRKTPDVHMRIAEWLGSRTSKISVLMAHRGIGKSYLLPIYNAWRFYSDKQYQILHQAATDKDAKKNSSATQTTLRRHPLSKGVLGRGKLNIYEWRIIGSELLEPGHYSYYARGVKSNVTGGRATEVENDDVEVPSTSDSEDKRDKLKSLLGEQTHILKPGGRILYVGTPHTFDSIYMREIEQGADSLIVKLFEKEHRLELTKDSGTRFFVGFEPEMVFYGIGSNASLLMDEVDYQYADGYLTLASPCEGLIDCYSGLSWPEYFTPEETLNRRRRVTSINDWDSQYQMHAKPVSEVRLDPYKLRVYEEEPTIVFANQSAKMMLGAIQIVGASCVWDPSSGKKKSDGSAVTVLLTDAKGHFYWQYCGKVLGEIAIFGDTEDTIVGGQVMQVCDIVERFGLTSVTVETNGIGGFAPTILRQALKTRGLSCGVKERHESRNKTFRILAAIETPLTSRFLWAHKSVVMTTDGEISDVAKQMRDFNPLITTQPDDYIDTLAGAILETPVRVGRNVGNAKVQRPDWKGQNKYNVKIRRHA